MKRILAAFAAVATLLAVSTPAMADMALANSKNCMACHAIEKKLVGPSYKDIATKYAGQADAVDKLSGKVIKGGAGAWGPVPMPANPQVSDADAKKLVAWILAGSK
jgi:cytochrome c